MVFPFFAEEAKRKAELEELALSAEPCLKKTFLILVA